MKFYRLNKSFEKKIIGSNPQVTLIGGERGLPFFESFNKSPDLQFETKPGAKLTDLIKVDSPGISFLFNQRAKTLMEGFRLPNHQWFPVIILHKNTKVEEYHYFHLTEHFHESIDYANSLFAIIRSVDKIDQKKFGSFNDILNFNKLNPLLDVNPEKLFVNNDIITNYDYLNIYRGDSYPVISEGLKKTFEKERFTGIEFVSCPYLDHYSK